MEEWAHAIKSIFFDTVIKSICYATAISPMSWASFRYCSKLVSAKSLAILLHQLPRNPIAGFSAFSSRGFHRTVAFGSALS